jgi:hydrogenase-4 component F
LLAASVLNCAVYAILRFYVLAVKCLGPAFPGGLLLFFGAASMIVAVPFVLVQRNFRRLLAYSSIEHAGIMVTAIGFGGRLGLIGAMLHMMFHAMTKPLLFFCIGDVQQHFQTAFLRRVHGAIRSIPLTATLLVMVTMAVTGVPPFSIFQSEFTILSAGFASSHTLLSLLFIACVVTIFAGFLQHVVQMMLGTPREATVAGTQNRWKIGIVCILALTILAIGLHLPEPLFKLAQNAADVIGGAP